MRYTHRTNGETHEFVDEDGKIAATYVQGDCDKNLTLTILAELNAEFDPVAQFKNMEVPAEIKGMLPLRAILGRGGHYWVVGKNDEPVRVFLSDDAQAAAEWFCRVINEAGGSDHE